MESKNQMITITKKTKILCGLLIFCAQLLQGSQFVAALNTGPGGGNGGGNGCTGENYGTCHGSSWRYYSATDDYIDIRGTSAGASAPGGQIINCATDGGGYWRYAFELKPGSSLRDRDTSRFQYGIGSIGGRVDTHLGQKDDYRSEFFDGGNMNYYDKGAFDTGILPANDEDADYFKYPDKFDDAIKRFSEWKLRGEDGFTASWAFVERLYQKYVAESENPNDHLSWNATSKLGWFCNGDMDKKLPDGEVQTRSNVRVGSDASNYVTTNWEKDARKNMPGTAQAGGDPISVTFSHEARYTENVPQGVTMTRTVELKQTRSGSATPTITGATHNTSTTYTANYTPTAKNQAVAVYDSHTYKLTFPSTAPQNSNFTICEKVTVNNNKFSGKDKAWVAGTWTSEVCAAITVTTVPVPPPPDPPDTITCESLKATNPTLVCSGGPDAGTTSGLSQVRNVANPNSWKTGTEALWAKPGDSIQFRHFLFPGAQAVRVSRSHGAHCTTASTSSTATCTTANGARDLVITNSNYLSISSAINGTANNNYRLGTELSTNVVPPASDVAVQPGSSTPVVLHSPSTPSNDTANGLKYSCGVSLFPAYNPSATTKGGGFQLPGFGSYQPSCNSNSSNNNPFYITMVGKTFRQTMNYWGPITASAGVTEKAGQDGYTWKYTYPYSYRESYWSSTCRPAGNVAPAPPLGCTRTRTVNATGNGTGWHTNDYFTGAVNTSATQSSPRSSYAEVKVPYNYKTSIDGNFPNFSNYGGPQKTISAGTKISLNSPQISVEKRINPHFDGTSANYATVSKPSEVRVITYIINNNQTFSPTYLGGTKEFPGNSNATQSQLCAYFSANTRKCEIVHSESNTYNAGGSLNGSNDLVWKNWSGTIVVPDNLALGEKICVAVAVWPSDSHDLPNGTATTAQDAISMNSAAGSNWNISRSECRTIAKKPSVQIWGAGVYVEGSITTSRTEKIPDSTSYSDTRNPSVFGSWSERETIAQGSGSLVKGFASGAALGYNENARPVNSRNITTASTTSSRLSVSSSAYGGFPAPASDCSLTKMTITNRDCSSGNIGKANIEFMPTAAMDGLKKRYQGFMSSYVPNGATCILLNVTDIGCDGGHANIETPPSQTSIDGTTTSTSIIRIMGSAYIPTGAVICTSAAPDGFSRTVILDVQGTLVIGSDIKLGRMSGGTCVASEYANASEISQNLIFADKIQVLDKVRQIDAWLIIKGSLDTCVTAGDSNNITSPQAYSYKGSSLPRLDSGKCNLPLVFNGPVMASSVILNRTAGTDAGTNSIKPAEIFNLRADAHLWTYAQMQRYTQAAVTYTRELAPRY